MIQKSSTGTEINTIDSSKPFQFFIPFFFYRGKSDKFTFWGYAMINIQPKNHHNSYKA